MRHSLQIAIASLLLTGTAVRAAAVPEEAINRAVERGVAALRKGMGAEGRLPGGLYTSGATSLAAATLLECGVSPDDEQVRMAVAAVRADCPTMNRVYPLSLAIMLLDRVGDTADVPIIHILAVRLLEGQKPEGGWHYSTPDVASDEVARVRDLLRRRGELKTSPGESRPSLAPDLLERIRQLLSRQNGPGGLDVDNSNTQFAILGLWVARRNGVPADFALRRAEAYFRATHVRGVWPYIPTTTPEDRPANTCAGLLGLAVGTGLIREAQLRTQTERKTDKPPALRDPLKDPLVQAAMNYVGAQVAQAAAAGLEPEVSGSRTLYFLWSVERVGMVYSVPVMGGVDWYQVGAAAILRAQQPTGSWPDRMTGLIATPSQINTCFALLFLKRSNFASDLTANLRKKPAQTALRAGGDKGEPPAEIEPSAAERLAHELPTAPPARQVAVLAELRDGKGDEYTLALARVIPRIAGDVQTKARDALAERLARMTAATLRAKLKDGDVEVRRASALACAMKDDKGFIPDLIAVLDDAEAWVVRAAAVSLRTLTGQDFGPAANASPAERAKAVAAWKAWWKQQGGR